MINALSLTQKNKTKQTILLHKSLIESQGHLIFFCQPCDRGVYFRAYCVHVFIQLSHQSEKLLHTAK